MEMEQKTLISELKQGKELAKQLWCYLQPSSSPEAAGVLLIEKILSSYEKALSVLNAIASEEETSGGSIGMRNGVARRDLKEKEVYKKRKLTANWSEQVRVCSVAGLEGPAEDGYSWRKYGQKEILGARFPRGYFRCSHRFAQGCLATKQVQRSDEDPSMFEVTYKGQHTCNQILNSATKQPAEESPKEALNQQEKRPNHQNPPIPKQERQESCLTFDADEIRVKSENLPICFPSPSSIRHEFRNQQSIFPENQIENAFAGISSQSSSKSKSDYFFGLWPENDHTFGSESAEFVSVPSISISDLEEYCAFDNLEFFY